VHAQPSRAAIHEAEQLFDEARALVKDQRYAEACDKFARSFELGQVIGAELNLGDCAERDGRFAVAWRLFDAAARDWERKDDGERARFARASADRVATKLATIVVMLADPIAAGVTVRIGERELSPAREIRELVDPCKVEVVVTVPGRPPVRQTVDTRAGATTTIDGSVIAPPTPAPAPTPAPVSSASRGEPAPIARQRSRVTELALGGGAIALAGGALGMWRWSAGTYDRAVREANDVEQEQLTDKARRQIYIAQGLGVVSIACAGLAAWLYVRRSNHEPSAIAKAARVTVAPMLARDRAGLFLEGRY
jgi:hypothetical protein